MASDHTHHDHEQPALGKAKDPVCGMQVDREHPRGGTYEHADTAYGFCGPKCRERFAADPESFLAKPKASSCCVPNEARKAKPQAPQEETAIDPVCGMTVRRAEPRGGTFDHEGDTFYFCNSKCRERFVANPAAYLDPQKKASSAPAAGTSPAQSYVCPMDPEVREAKPGPCPKCGMALEPQHVVVATKTEWVCPMHPEVVKPGPGSCPICGMALEPRTAAADDENPELKDMQRRFWVATALSVPLLALTMGEMLFGHGVSSVFPGHARGWVELVLATPVCLWAGLPFLERAVASIKNRHLNMFT